MLELDEKVVKVLAGVAAGSFIGGLCWGANSSRKNAKIKRLKDERDLAILRGDLYKMGFEAAIDNQNTEKTE